MSAPFDGYPMAHTESDPEVIGRKFLLVTVAAVLAFAAAAYLIVS